MKKLWRKLATLAAAVVAAFGAFSAPVTAYAEESETVATSVMEDLQTDATFSADNYPAKTIAELKAAGEEYLQVIKIGESVNNELYVYVYQPTDAEKEIEAKKILIGQTVNESAASVYSLKLISTDGVFDKYLVDGLNVLASFDVRHYQITSLYRPFDTALDEEKENGGKDTYIAVPVAQTWYARNVDGGGIEYAHTYDEVITITDEWHGSIRYSDGITADGLNFMKAYTTSHVVAFTTNKKIEKLKSAEIYFNEYDYEHHFCPSCYGNVVSGDLFAGTAVVDDGYLIKKESSRISQHKKVDDKQTGSNTANGWWAHTYTWNRILTAGAFVAQEDSLSTSEIERLTEIASNSNGNGAFVLRFYETNYTYNPDGGKYHSASGSRPHICYADLYKGTEIADVAILKLTFETDGVVYTMGVVDSMTTPDTIPDGEHGFWEGIELNFKEGFNDLERTLRLISLSIGAIVLMGAIALIVFWITRLVKWIRESKGSG